MVFKLLKNMELGKFSL